MAKYTRHDPKNKKRNNHKRKSQEGRTPRMRSVDSYNRIPNEEHHISIHDTQRCS
jgi:hypothetical protein